ncbi:MAG: DNA topoisomerase (ATP-hydrolyzing), partial [Myxococcota bacterium]|nr:DNA topoisomerase (ATP-hydrolyzing) [Myxococcota bacterium]
MSDAVESVPLHSTTKERYLNYALSVITSRALPDVRDGLKPVQRRILYGMQQLRLSPDARHTKCAQIVGEVMGKYHPHGDSAIYEALVRMAQSFSLRAPLVDGQGNFGSLDGDTAAAMRYTEAKLFPLATELLSDLSKEIVPFRPTYDGSREEPVVLPAAFPNLLVNGSSGIAVGLATNIPPHDLGEILRACVLLIDKPDCTLQELMKVLPAPDFPTGGRILSSAEEIAEVYRKGRGPIELRGDFEVETEGKRKRIAITSIPYATNKAQLVERIAEQVRSGKLPQVLDVRDESTELVRIVLELRAQADPEAVMAFLFKHTPLQSRFSVNLTCLVPVGEMGCRPQQLGLLEMLRHFLEFRFEVVSRRLALRLRELRERIHILEAFERIFDAIDEAIAIIRASRDRAEAGLRLRERFDLDELQSNAILDTRLYRLAQLEIEEIRADLASKRAEAEQLEALLA